MDRCPQFVTGEYRPTQAFLPDTEYSLALDCLTKAVSDVLVFNHDQSKILLGKRKIEPQPDWWFIGGRARPGETTKEAAARNMRRETGLGISPKGCWSFQFTVEPSSARPARERPGGYFYGSRCYYYTGGGEQYAYR